MFAARIRSVFLVARRGLLRPAGSQPETHCSDSTSSMRTFFPAGVGVRKKLTRVPSAPAWVVR